MSGAVPGGPTKQDINRFAGPTPGSAVSNKYATINDPSDARTNEYPVVPFAPDKYDTIASIKQAVGSEATKGTYGEKWMVPFTEQDAQYLLRQQAQAENVNYERWLWQQYDVSDPAQAWIFQQIAPEQFEKRKQLILYQQNLATRYAMLRLYGVKSEDDLMLKYLVDTKKVELPKGPIWDPQKWMASQYGGSNAVDTHKNWAGRYRAGMFSPLKWVNETQTGHLPGPNRADPLSISNTAVADNMFVGSQAALENTPYGYYGKTPTWARPEFNDSKVSGTELHARYTVEKKNDKGEVLGYDKAY